MQQQTRPALLRKNLLHHTERPLQNFKSIGVGEVQLLKIENNKPVETPVTISIDNLLDSIHKGETDNVRSQINVAINKLTPLITLMTDPQKRQLIE